MNMDLEYILSRCMQLFSAVLLSSQCLNAMLSPLPRDLCWRILFDRWTQHESFSSFTEDPVSNIASKLLGSSLLIVILRPKSWYYSNKSDIQITVHLILIFFKEKGRSRQNALSGYQLGLGGNRNDIFNDMIRRVMRDYFGYNVSPSL